MPHVNSRLRLSNALLYQVHIQFVDAVLSSSKRRFPHIPHPRNIRLYSSNAHFPVPQIGSGISRKQLSPV
jgi:hypothetical protein